MLYDQHMARNNRVFHLIWIVSLATTSILALAQDTHRLENVASCRQVAQDFYGWYVPFYEKHGLQYRTADVALQRKAALFNPALLQALKVDFAAQRRSNEIVGIDFDPFVGNDGGENYEVRKVSLKDDRCFVEVWQSPVSENPSWKPDKPDVIAELSKQAGHWQFRNFRYADMDNDDLISALEGWREARCKQK